MDCELGLEPWDFGRTCVVCGSPYVQTHHVLHGSHRRRFAEKYGYTIPLCQEHHTGRSGVHQNADMDLAWKQRAQQHYEMHYGSREDWIRECGKSYL